MSTDDSTETSESHDPASNGADNDVPYELSEDGSSQQDAAQRGRSLATLLAIQNGTQPPELDDDAAADLGVLSANALSKAPGSMAPGTSFMGTSRHRSNYGESPDGRRDYLDNFSYPKPGEMDAQDYQDRADRQDPAFTLTYRPVSTTWRYDPRIHDDGSDEDADPTDFEQDIQSIFDTLPHGSGLPAYWEWADRKQRPCNYGLLLLGLDDGRELAEPVDEAALDNVEDLQYCNTFSQADVTSWRTAGEYDRSAPIRDGVVRPDKPVLYELRFDRPTADGDVTTDSKLVHYSRIIHIVEEPTSSEYIGRSCLERHINRLFDYEKVMGSSAEAHYASVDRKFIVNADDDSAVPTNDLTDHMEQYDKQLREMLNDMRTAMFTQNSDVDVIGGSAIDPTGMVDKLYESFAGPSGMPQRIMTGSERGDLASTQDRYNYLEGIGERQGQFVNDAIVRPSIARLIRFGVVSDPLHPDNEFTITWPELFSLTELERADLQAKRAKALKDIEAAIASGADRETAYEYAGVPRAGEGSGTSGSAEPVDAANALDENNTHVQDAVDFSVPGSGS